MATSPLRSSGGWSEDLKRLEQVMNVFVELGGENEPELADLVTPYRRFVREESVLVKQAPFSTSKAQPRVVFLFEDLLIFAAQPKSILAAAAAPLRRKSSGKQRWFSLKLKKGRSMKRTKSAKENNTNSGNQKSRQSTSSASSTRSSLNRRKLNMVSKLDLKKTSVKKITNSLDGLFGLQVTHVTRVQKLVKIPSATDKNNGTLKTVTQIEKYELWCQTEDIQNSIFNDMYRCIDALEEQEERRRTSSGESGSVGGGKQRKWARAKSTSRSSGRHSRANSGSSAGSTATFDSVNGLGLKDLEARYHVEKTDYAANTGGDKKEFLVQFGDGPMGFSLSSGAGVGVIVGRLATGSFAELGGVNIGDRLVSINNTEIPLDMHWQKAVDVIKHSGRPLTIKFERYSAVTDKVAKSDGNGGERERTSSERQRRWASRRSDKGKSMGSRLLSLKELEKMYDNASETTSDVSIDILATFDKMAERGTTAERMCVKVLKEMYDTERTYVNDLRTMVGDYILPLKRTTQRIKCKDVDDGSRLCEHTLLRAACTKVSSAVRPMLSPEDLRGIFMNVETLVKVNTELLQHIQNGMVGLQKGDKVPNVTQVVAVMAPAFVKVMPFFKMYSLYCHQYPIAIDKLLVCRSRNRDLNQLLLQREERSKQQSLQSLLIKPVQRICKYPLLFKELIKNIMPYVQECVKKGHSIDTLNELVTSLEKAGNSVQQIAQTVNRKVGEKDNLERLMEVYVELGGEHGVPGLVQPSRRFVATFDVMSRTTPFDDKNEIKRSMLYVFNDLLIVAKGTNAAFNTLKRNNSSTSLNSSGSSYSSSLKKGLASLVSSSSSSSGADSRRSNSLGKHASSRSSGSRSSSGIQQLYKMTHWLDLKQVQIKDNQYDAGVSFVLKHIVRQKEDTPAVKKRSTWRKSAESPIPIATTASGRVVTSINKHEVWCRDVYQRNELFELITKLITKLDDLDAGQRQAEESVGPSGIKKKKSWFNKHNRTRSGSSVSEHSSNSASVLQDLERKYIKAH